MRTPSGLEALAGPGGADARKRRGPIACESLLVVLLFGRAGPWAEAGPIRPSIRIRVEGGQGSKAVIVYVEPLGYAGEGRGEGGFCDFCGRVYMWSERWLGMR